MPDQSEQWLGWSEAEPHWMNVLGCRWPGATESVGDNAGAEQKGQGGADNNGSSLNGGDADPPNGAGDPGGEESQVGSGSTQGSGSSQG